MAGYLMIENIDCASPELSQLSKSSSTLANASNISILI